MAEAAVLVAVLKCGIVCEEGRSDMDESGEERLG